LRIRIPFRIPIFNDASKITIHTARPGIVIGKKGADIESLKSIVTKMMGMSAHINIEEIKKPELDSRLVAENIAQQLEKRVMYRRAVKRVLGNATRLGAQGIKVMVSGRLNGAEIAILVTIDFNDSISAPFLPITIPGRAVWIVILALLAKRSI
jgi:ribosomal protein S3